MGRASPHLRLAPALLLGLAWLQVPPASAQSQGLVLRDGTLGNSPLEVGPGIDPLGQPATYLITPEMGEQRGRNLFHSFLRFGIASGETATFTGPDPIDGPQSVSNVISRVTGGEPSEIDGRLRSTIPGADVWLFNPSGVGFGKGAELDVKGSFHAATADYVGFKRGESFYADRSSVLATAPPAAFGFLPGSAAAPLAVEGSTLEVLPGEALELVSSGDVSLSGATLTTHKTPEPAVGGGGEGFGRIRGRPRPVGHVGLEAQGQVKLTDAIVDGESVPSLVDVSGGAPGTISIRGGQIFIEKGSQVLAENTGAGPGGSIDVVAGELLTVDAGLLSANTSAAGDAGRIHLASPAITVQNGPGIVEVPNDPADPRNNPHATKVGVSAETEAGGRGGEIEIEAGALTVQHGASVSARTFGPAATGDAGTIRVDADRVTVQDRSEIAASAWRSLGNAGEIDLDVAESLLVDGTDGYAWINAGSVFEHIVPRFEDERRKGVQAGPGAPGRITITGPGGRASSVMLLNSGMIETACLPCTSKLGDPHRPQDAGTIHIAAEQVLVQGWGPTSSNPAHATAHTTGVGDAGTVEIDAVGVKLLDSGVLGAVSNDAGDAGVVDVQADELVIRGAAPDHYLAGIYVASWLGSGRAGTIRVRRGDSGGAVTIGTSGTILVNSNTSQADTGGRIDLDVDSLTIEPGGLLSATTGGSSPGGTITIRTIDAVTIEGTIETSTFGAGDAGDITIRAIDAVTIEGTIETSTFGAGDAGDILIDAGSLELRDGGQIRSRGQTGNGGDVVVNADTVQIGPGRETGKAGPGIHVTAFGTGNAGSVRITANDWIHLDDWHGDRFDLSPVLVGRPAFLTGIVSATGGGAAGPITLDAREIAVSNGAIVTSSSIHGLDGGDIVLRGDRIRIESGGTVTGTSFGTPYKAGGVTLDASESIEVVGRSAFGDPSQVASSTLNQGPAGSVRLTAPRILVDEGVVATAAVPLQNGEAGGAGGLVTLVAERELVVRNGGQVTASTLGPGDGGLIDIRAGESIRVEGTGSSIASRTGADGTGGDVVLSAPRIEVASGGEVSAESRAGFGELGPIVDSLREHLKDPPPIAKGNAGSITLAASQLVHLDDGDITTSSPRGEASGGDITIDPVFVILENGSRIVATADNGHGGHVRITTDNFFQFPGSMVSAQAARPELSGTVEIHSPDVNLAGTLTPLPSAFLDAASLMRERCAARRHGERSGSFSVRGPGGIPSEPDGWLRAPVLLPDTAATATATPGPLALVASLPGPLLAHGTCP